MTPLYATRLSHSEHHCPDRQQGFSEGVPNL
jgi:hypothetical protein